MNDFLLDVFNLKTHFNVNSGIVKAVDGASFTINKGQIAGIIGESGCGKSVTGFSILNLIKKPGKIVSGEILLHRNKDDIIDLSKTEPEGKMIRSIRGKDITMIFQEPMTSLSPVHKIGDQIMESLFLHTTDDKGLALEITMNMLKKVGITNPSDRINQYPHELSGGLRQRVMIAMALCTKPMLLIADEPTTALDVTIQAQIIELIQEIQDELKMAVLFITHDLGVISEICQKVIVMYLGKVIETAPVKEIFKQPLHPYLKSLIKSVPKLEDPPGRKLEVVSGTVPVPINLPIQCGFYSRCKYRIKGKCNKQEPELYEISPGHSVACFLYSNKRKVYE